MENFSELIKNRRSMRKFTDEELTQDQVVALMKAALMSPSSKRSNSWQFVVVDDKEVLKELSHCKEQASSFIADAALAIVVMADPLASDVWIEDASIASIMIQLQAEDLAWEAVGCRFANVSLLPECLPMNLSMESWIFPCNFRFFPLLLSDIKGWNVNLSMKNIFNGRKFILTSSEENKYGSC